MQAKLEAERREMTTLIHSTMTEGKVRRRFRPPPPSRAPLLNPIPLQYAHSAVPPPIIVAGSSPTHAAALSPPCSSSSLCRPRPHPRAQIENMRLQAELRAKMQLAFKVSPRPFVACAVLVAAVLAPLHSKADHPSIQAPPPS
jgi:hypothetical protein